MSMPEDTDITDITEDPLTVQDILDEATEAPYHTILEVWRAVMEPAKKERHKKITPQWANRITSSYRQMNFADMPDFKDRYFSKIDALRHLLDVEIASDDECLNLTSPEEDAEINAFHYVNLLIEWQKMFHSWELEWDCTLLGAAAELAAISEVHRMMFDQAGLTSLLDNINFQFTDTHRDLLATALQEQRDLQEMQ